MSYTKKWLKQFFSGYFWLGIVLILLSITLNLQFPKLPLPISILVTLIHTIGVTILVAAIFTFTSGTSEFVDKISELLRNIVIDRNFLGNIDPEGKRDALAALIKPSETDRQRYSDIGRYYDVFINHTLNITKKCVRSDYSVEARAYKSEDKVEVEQRISYRLHPTVNGFTDIEVHLDEKDLGSLFKWIRVSTPNGDVVYDGIPEPKYIERGGNLSLTAVVPLKELGIGFSHLRVSSCFIEKGHDHWIHLCYQSLEPTDGFSYHLECYDNLKICAINSFINGAEFLVRKEGTHLIDFSCHEWFNEGTGIAIVVSENQLNEEQCS